ncbi:MAG: DUF1194 domain-containing protein [Methylobacteriaceae bacterium]|nr:DUF1194 domain-containing protein [Methylobacteriaceae bacterium]MBV9243975.1 DUF1194 domain-containing protein [Methylobacteriaceae bacterium]
MPDRPSPTLLLAVAAGVLGLFVSLPAAAKGGPVAVDAEIVLAVDISFSMNDEEQRLQRAGYVEAIESAEFLQALKANQIGKIAVTYIEWASYGDEKVLVEWTLIDGPESARTFADRLAEAPFRRARRTSISGAIDASMRLFEGNGFAGARRVIDISGDGPNNDGRGVVAAREDAVEKGATINGLPLVNIRPYVGFADIQNLDVYYEDCVIGGPGAFMVPVSDTKKFVEATRTKLIEEIAEHAPAPTEPLIRPVNSAEPRVSCTVGETMWQKRFGK